MDELASSLLLDGPFGPCRVVVYVRVCVYVCVPMTQYEYLWLTAHSLELSLSLVSIQ